MVFFISNESIKTIAMQQSALDLNCNTLDFMGQDNKVVLSKLNQGRKKYFTKEHFCKMCCYGNAMVASVSEQIEPFMTDFACRHTGYRCFEQMNTLAFEFAKYGKQIKFSEYFLPDVTRDRAVTPDFDVKIFKGDDIRQFYEDDRFHMALSYAGRSDENKDVLAVVGYLHGNIVGIAGASNDSECMWQVGIDVVAEYRHQRVATALVKIITDEILHSGIVPFYGSAWSNIASKNVAISSGYKASWCELSAEDIKVQI